MLPNGGKLHSWGYKCFGYDLGFDRFRHTSCTDASLKHDTIVAIDYIEGLQRVHVYDCR